MYDVPSEIEVIQGGSKSITIEAKNDGDVRLYNVYIKLSGIDTEWFSVNPEKHDRIDPDESKYFTLKLHVPENALLGSYTVKLELISQGITMDIKTIKVTISQGIEMASEESNGKPKIVVTGLYLPKLNPGEKGNFSIIFRNDGNATAEIEAWLDVPEGWNVTPNLRKIDLEPNETEIVEFEVHIPTKPEKINKVTFFVSYKNETKTIERTVKFNTKTKSVTGMFVGSFTGFVNTGVSLAGSVSTGMLVAYIVFVLKSKVKKKKPPWNSTLRKIKNMRK